MSIEEILEERNKTHGDFLQHSAISQRLKGCVQDTAGWYRLVPLQREAVEMVIHKIARILAGNPHYKDHWDDGAGYFSLVSKWLEKEKRG